MTGPSDERPVSVPRSASRTPNQSTSGGGASSAGVSSTGPASGPQAHQTYPPQRSASASSPQARPGDGQTEYTSAVPPAGGGQVATGSPGQSAYAGGSQGGAEATRPTPIPNRPSSSPARTVRRAKLRLVRLDPWSVTKASFLLSIAFGIMCVVAVFLVFSIMSASGLWDSVNSTIQGVVDQKPKDAFDIKEYVGMNRIMGITMLIAAIDVVIITALATLGAFIYNMAASLLGGVEITLAEDLR